MTQELKPCPFCGSTDIEVFEDPRLVEQLAHFDDPSDSFGVEETTWIVLCCKCSARGPHSFESEDRSKAAWNLRTL